MDAHGARSPGGQVGQAEGRGVHDADDRLGLIVRAEFEQGGGHCPFAHMAYVVDHTVDFADVPVTLAGRLSAGRVVQKPSKWAMSAILELIKRKILLSTSSL